MVRLIWPPVLLALCLAGVCALVKMMSPGPQSISGNGFHPLQLLALNLCLTVGATFLVAVGVLAARAGTRLAGRWGAWVPALLAALLVVAGVTLLGASWVGFRAYERGTFYYQRWGPHHRLGVVNQHTVAYWATAWPFWSGLAALAASLGMGRGAVQPGSRI